MIYFITFGSHDNYIDAAKRLILQAENLNIFDKIILYTLDDIELYINGLFELKLATIL